MTWRLALPPDDAAIVTMSQELFAEDPCPWPVPPEHTRRTLSALRADPVRGRAVVLERDGRAEAYALLVSYWSNELGGEVCPVDELYIRPGLRGQGLGSALLESLARPNSLWPRVPVAIELEVHPGNTRARGLYSRLGFKPSYNAKMQRQLR